MNTSFHNGTRESERSIIFSNVIYISWITLAVLLYLGVFLNAMVIYVMLRSGQVRKNISSFLIFHLSVTQLLFQFVLQMAILTVANSLRFCKASIFIQNACAAAIFSSLVAIAWDRHRNISQPFKSLAPKTLKSYLYLISAIWMYATISSIAFIQSARLETVVVCRKEHNASAPTNTKCETYSYCDLPPDWRTQLSQTIYFVMAFLVPLFYMMAAYTRIAIRLWKRTKNSTIHGAVAKSKAKSIRFLIVVVLGFALCWGPNFFIELLLRYELLENLSKESNFMLQIWTLLGQAFSSCINPAIYAFFSPDFRANSLKFCCCCCSSCRSCVRPRCTFSVGRVCPSKPRSRSFDLGRDNGPRAIRAEIIMVPRSTRSLDLNESQTG